MTAYERYLTFFFFFFFGTLAASCTALKCEFAQIFIKVGPCCGSAIRQLFVKFIE